MHACILLTVFKLMNELIKKIFHLLKKLIQFHFDHDTLQIGTVSEDQIKALRLAVHDVST